MVGHQPHKNSHSIFKIVVYLHAAVLYVYVNKVYNRYRETGKHKQCVNAMQANLAMRRQREAIRQYQPGQAEWLQRRPAPPPQLLWWAGAEDDGELDSTMDSPSWYVTPTDFSDRGVSCLCRKTLYANNVWSTVSGWFIPSTAVWYRAIWSTFSCVCSHRYLKSFPHSVCGRRLGRVIPSMVGGNKRGITGY